MIEYIWSKMIKKLMGRAIKNSIIHKSAKVESQSTVVNTIMGKKSYCGYGCLISNCTIGNYCSISDNVTIGGGSHPIHWVSTSPAFYYGKDSITKELASLSYDYTDEQTQIGHDVWIGHGVHIKSGIQIGVGAIVGMGSVVTKDVEPYTIVAGNPAVEIRKRFSQKTIQILLDSKWWEMDDELLFKYTHCFDDVDKFSTTIKETNP